MSPTYLNTRKAAARLGYSERVFRRYLAEGWIAGAERQGSGPMPPWRFRTADLAYVGPVQRPFDRVEAERARAAEAARIEAEELELAVRNPYLRGARRRAT